MAFAWKITISYQGVLAKEAQEKLDKDCMKLSPEQYEELLAQSNQRTTVTRIICTLLPSLREAEETILRAIIGGTKSIEDLIYDWRVSYENVEFLGDAIISKEFAHVRSECNGTQTTS